MFRFRSVLAFERDREPYDTPVRCDMGRNEYYVGMTVRPKVKNIDIRLVPGFFSSSAWNFSIRSLFHGAASALERERTEGGASSIIADPDKAVSERGFFIQDHSKSYSLAE